MKKDMPLEGLRWSRDSGSTLCDTPQNGRSRTGWGGNYKYLVLRIICVLYDDVEIDLFCLGGIEKLCNFAAVIQ